MGAPAWQRRLAKQDAQLRPVPAERDMWGVYPDGDRRKRPLSRVPASVVLTARAEGIIQAVGEETYALARSPEAFHGRADGDFRRQHRVLLRKNFIDQDGHLSNREIDIGDTPLARWVKPDKGSGETFLTPEEIEASERLRRDYHRSVLTDRTTVDWASFAASARSTAGRTREDAPASAYDAKERVLNALVAVGPGLDRVLTAVCLREMGMQSAEEENGWVRRSGKTLLKIALQRLAVYYGLVRYTPDLTPIPRLRA